MPLLRGRRPWWQKSSRIFYAAAFTLLNLWPVNADPKQVEQLAAEVRPAVLDRLS